jgi:uncharacterized protein with HEPN domain
MLAAARRAAELAQGRAKTDVEGEPILADAIIWRLTIIGEAAARVSAEGRAALPSLRWSEIVGMRNRLVHGYDAIRFDLVWGVLIDDLPPLIAALDQVLAVQADSSC